MIISRGGNRSIVGGRLGANLGCVSRACFMAASLDSGLSHITDALAVFVQYVVTDRAL